MQVITTLLIYISLQVSKVDQLCKQIYFLPKMKLNIILLNSVVVTW